MNTPIVRLFVLVCLLFGLVVAFTSRWTVFEADALRDNKHNRRDEIADRKIRRGVIRAAGGRTLMARSRPGPGESYRRSYPNARLFSHLPGYSSLTYGRAGLEQYYNDELAGRRNEISTIMRQLQGREQEGDDLITNIDPEAQQVALEALAGRKGAVVAIEPDSGRVKVLAALPTFDPNDIERDWRQLNSDDETAPLLFRATQGRYAPGSTFKVVTATAALDGFRYSPDSVVNGDNGKVVSGVPLNNFGSKSWGDVTLTQALTHSVNTVWAQVAVELGRKRMAEYMERFGFYSRPGIDLPADEVAISGNAGRKGDLVRPTSRATDLGRMAIGQDKLLVTPLQMAQVAATIANDGVRMKPLIARRTVDEDGRTVDDFEPQEEERVMSEGTARRLTVMMKNVVKEGTGTASALQGVEVAGKTGTAERNTTGLNQPWFIGFTDEVAVAVTIETLQGGQGGTDAAPIAKQVMEALGAE